MGDNIWLPDRNGVRTPMQWNDTSNAGFSSASPELFYSPVITADEYGSTNVNVFDQISDATSLLNQTAKFIQVRKAHPAFGWGSLDWIDVGNTRIAAYLRQYKTQTILVLNNLSNQSIEISVNCPSGWVSLADLFSNIRISIPYERKLQLSIEPYTYFWFNIITSDG